MKKTLLLALSLPLLGACSGDKPDGHIEEDAIVASETGQPIPLPSDALYATKPLISGKLYLRPDFKASTVVYFDTTQRIYILDTTNVMFAKARLHRDTSSHTGYIPKTILPERK